MGIAVLAVIVVVSFIQMPKKEDTSLVEEKSAVPVSSVAPVEENKTDTNLSAVAVVRANTYESKEFGVKFQYPKETEVKTTTATPKTLLSVSLFRDKNNTNDKETFAASYPVKGEPSLEEIRKQAANTAVTLGDNVWYRFVFPSYNKDIANYVIEKNGIEYSYTFPLTEENAVKKILSTVIFTVPAN